VLFGAHVGAPHVTPSHIEASDVLFALLATCGALAAAALGLFGRPLRESAPDAITAPARRIVHRVRGLHSGHIGDYIAWWSAGASLIAGVCLLAIG
jgi:multicomponent Na+:H+ antiporter subunit D